MENLISSIQHFFIVAFAAVTATTMVALPFHKPPTYPTPSPKQEVRVKGEATSSANPSPGNQQSQPKSQTSNTFVTPAPATSTLINCTGPDGKTIRLTQKQCDDFNSSWNKPRINSGNNPQIPPSTNNPTTSNSNSPAGTYYYPNTYYPSSNNSNPPTNNGLSNTQPSPAPVSQQPVDNSLDLRICLNNEERSWEIQMDDLNRRGVWYSGQADQARSNHEARLQSCYQQYGN